MMNETVQYERTQAVMPDFGELKKLTEDCRQGQVREQGITKIREIDSRQDKRNPKLRKRFVQGPLSRQWLRLMNLDDTYRMPSLFTWRC
jgi:hypothetical protein